MCYRWLEIGEFVYLRKRVPISPSVLCENIIYYNDAEIIGGLRGPAAAAVIMMMRLIQSIYIYQVIILSSNTIINSKRVNHVFENNILHHGF